jgi:hypothetical protein
MLTTMSFGFIGFLQFGAAQISLMFLCSKAGLSLSDITYFFLLTLPHQAVTVLCDTLL